MLAHALPVRLQRGCSWSCWAAGGRTWRTTCGEGGLVAQQRAYIWHAVAWCEGQEHELAAHTRGVVRSRSRIACSPLAAELTAVLMRFIIRQVHGAAQSRQVPRLGRLFGQDGAPHHRGWVEVDQKLAMLTNVHHCSWVELQQGVRAPHHRRWAAVAAPSCCCTLGSLQYYRSLMRRALQC